MDVIFFGELHWFINVYHPWQRLEIAAMKHRYQTRSWPFLIVAYCNYFIPEWRPIPYVSTCKLMCH